MATRASLMDTADLLRLLASIAAGYLLGSIPFAYLAARGAGVDIFQVGTRNPGAANIFRTIDRRLGAAVFVTDALKGVAAVLVARALGVPVEMAACAGGAAVAGHWVPVFLRFRGGAGLATAAGAALTLSPIAGVIALAAGLAALLLIRSSGHAAAVALVVLLLAIVLLGDGWAVAGGAAGLGALVFGRNWLLVALRARRTG